MAENYHVKKDVDLKALAKERGLNFKEDEIARQDLIALLKMNDMESGTAEEPLVADETGLKPVEPTRVPCTRVRFHNTDRQDAKIKYIFVGVNGKSWYLPKEKDIMVPNFILNSAIKDAVETIADQVVHQDGSIEWVPRDIMRFPYQVITD